MPSSSTWPPPHLLRTYMQVTEGMMGSRITPALPVAIGSRHFPASCDCRLLNRRQQVWHGRMWVSPISQTAPHGRFRIDVGSWQAFRTANHITVGTWIRITVTSGHDLEIRKLKAANETDRGRGTAGAATQPAGRKRKAAEHAEPAAKRPAAARGMAADQAGAAEPGAAAGSSTKAAFVQAVLSAKPHVFKVGSSLDVGWSCCCQRCPGACT